MLSRGTVRFRSSLMLLSVLFPVSALWHTSEAQQPDSLAVPAVQWAKEAASNEVRIVHYSQPYLRYRLRKIDEKGDQTRDIIESRDGAVARLIARGGKPITRQQDMAERSRLQDMLNSPQAFARHIKNDSGGKKQVIELLQSLPSAMIYTYTPGQPQRSGRKPEMPAEIVLDFKPNPKWTPPTLSSEALTGLEGRLWIDSQTKILTRLETRIVQSVNVGWGMLAHIYPGGTATLEQVELPDQRFVISHLVEDLSIRAMMVRTIKVHTDLTTWAFSPVEQMTYQQAIQILLQTPLQTAD